LLLFTAFITTAIWTANRKYFTVMSKPAVRFCFDAISPYAWLAWRPLNDIVTRHDVTLIPVPVLFAGLLNANGQLGPAEIPQKRLWLIKDVMRRAAAQNMKVQVPPKHPFNPLLSLRVASVDMPHSTRLQLTGALLDAVWLHGLDVSDPMVVSEIVSSVGLDGALCLQAAESDAVKQKLRYQTASAVADGAFGVPTIFVNDAMFWGSESDTMEHIEMTILGRDAVDNDMYQHWKENVKVGAVRRRNTR
jgi:2-hydroxychromene-2-carboxylate isomerase